MIKTIFLCTLVASLFVVGFIVQESFAVEYGTPIEIIDSTGDGTNGLADPWDFVVDSNENVYVAGVTSSNVFKITPSGVITEILNSTDGLVNPFNIAVDSNDNVYVAGTASDNVFKITPSGTITEIIDSTGDGTNGLDYPRYIAVDSNDNVYVAGYFSSNVFKITPSGIITEIIDEKGQVIGGGTSTNFRTPIQIEVDSNDNVYVLAVTSKNVFKIHTPDDCSTDQVNNKCVINQIINAPSRYHNVQKIAVDSSNVVYIGAGSEIFKTSGGGSITKIIKSADGLNGPFNIAVDSNRNVYVGEANYDNFFKITQGGTITEIIIGGTGLSRAFDITVDSNDNVYAAGYGSNNAFKITPDGEITEIINYGDGLTSPRKLAVDSNDNVYVAGSISDNVFKIPVLDTIPPIITLNPPNPQGVTQNNPYYELGATCTDETDGDIPNITIVSNVVTSTIGTYQVTYDCADTSGNDATQVIRTVNVGIPPSAPLNLAVESGDSQVTISWNAPDSDGSSPIEYYSVKYRTDGEWPVQYTANGNTTSLTIPNLENDKAYQFFVHAHNAIGYSQENAYISGVPNVSGNDTDNYTTPSVPLNLKVYNFDSVVTVSWETPENDGGLPIDYYLVKYNNGTNWPSQITANASITNATFTGLQNDQSYWFYVHAHNGIGFSQENAYILGTPVP